MDPKKKRMELKFVDFHLKIEVLEETLLEGTPPPYNHSLKCQIEITSHSFSGQFRWDALMDDFRRFRDELKQMNENLGKTGEAILKGLEPGVEIQFKMNELGHIDGNFIFSDFSELGAEATKLIGSFQCDQTYLNRIIAEVRKICPQ